MRSSDFSAIAPEAYYELFWRSETVLSLPVTSGIFWGTSCVFWGLTAQYKLPFRVYVGISPREKGISIEAFWKFDPTTGKFLKDTEIDSFFMPHEGFLTTLQKLFPDSGFSLRILSESASREADVISFLSVASAMVKTGAATTSDIERIVSASYESNSQDAFFQELMEKTLRLRLDFNAETKGKSSMVSIYTGVSDGVSPRIHMSEANVPLAGREDCLKFVWERRLDYRSLPASEMLSTAVTDLPFETLLFHIEGIRNRYWAGTADHWTDLAASSMRDFNLRFGHSEKFLSSPADAKVQNHLMKRGAEATNDYSFATLSCLLGSFEGRVGHPELFASIERNFDAIGALLGKKNLNYVSRISTTVDVFPRMIKKLFPKFERQDFAVYLSGSSIDLNVAVFLPKDSRIDLSSITAAIAESFDTDPGVTLLFASFRDRYSSVGLRRNSLTDVFDKDRLSRTYVLKNVITGESHFWDKTTLFDRFVNDGILVDSETGKIYKNGEKSTSKDFLSQQFTADFLTLISRSTDGILKSSDLPSSSYSASVSEFTGKIVGPLRKAFFEITGSELPIDCGGSSWFRVSIRNEFPFRGLYVLSRAWG